MILIVGGAYQGKLKTAFGLLPDGNRREPEPVFGTREENPTAWIRVCTADGGEDSLEDAMKKPIINRFHEYIRRFCADGAESSDAKKAMQDFLERLVHENPDAIVVCNELGCGIVPMEKQDRLWREMTGDACQFLAERSVEVYRVICGIPAALKGGRV